MAREWHCLRSGDCCRRTPGLVLTLAELAELVAIAPEIPVSTKPYSPGFVTLKGRPCPYLGGAKGSATCTVHTVRPYNCRRFMCGRFDLTKERFVDETVPKKVLQDRSLRRQYERNQRRAQVWADRHDWRPEDR